MSDTYMDQSLGLTAYATPLNVTPTRLVNSVIVPGLIRVEGWTAASTNAGSQYVLCFDAMEVPADGAVPIFFQAVATNTAVGVYFGSQGRVFQRGLVLCTSSTNATKTINATADTFFDVQYAPIMQYPGEG